MRLKILQEPDYDLPALPPAASPTDEEREEMALQARELVANLTKAKQAKI